MGGANVVPLPRERCVEGFTPGWFMRMFHTLTQLADAT